MSPTYFTADKVFLGTDETSFTTAFAVSDGRFTWVGDAADVPADADPVRLGGTVLPGLLDVHTHATYVALINDAVACTVPMVHDIPGMLEALRGHRAYGHGPDAWIRGWGYDESKLAEGRTPTRHDLDQVSTTQPIHVLRSDCHSGICNSRALEIAGITPATLDPEGAEFGRDDDGTPNGVLVEHGANQAVMRAMGSAGLEAEAEALAATTHHFAERGLVAVTDMFVVPTDAYDHRELFREAAARGLRQAVRIYYDYAALRETDIRFTDADRTGRVAVAGIKLFADGSISNRTAWMRDPYPGTSDRFGMRLTSEEVMTEALAYARENRLQIAFHAMGDAAIEWVLDRYGDEEPWLTDRPSVRLEHATLMDADLVRRAHEARMWFGVASNVNFFYAEHDSYSTNLSAEQYARTYPVKDLYAGLDAAALSSDCPATTWADPDDVFMSIHAAVSRAAYNGEPIAPDQAVTVPQAVLLYTDRARRLLGLGDLGSIQPGKEASFVTLSQDVFTIDPARLADTRVTGTWIAGEQVYARG
ncbi:amidohydrolase [Mariniluteicoccus endophyticus]